MKKRDDEVKEQKTDNEVEVIQTIYTVLNQLPPEAQVRVIQWVVDKFDLDINGY